MQIEQVRLVETLAANAWRPEVEQDVGGWRLRFSGGSSRRVNSVWPNRDTGEVPLALRMEMVEDFYRRRGMPPRFQVCPAALPTGLQEVLETRGYTEAAHTSVKVQSSAELLAKAPPMVVDIQAADTLTEAWFETYTGASGYSQESLPVRRGILQRIGPPANFVLIHHDGRPAATGLGVAERGWLGVFCVVTAEGFRRQGLATAVMRALTAWGETQAAKQVYLQVMEDNPPALRLYDRLGFQKLYQYFYAEKVEDGR